ELNGSPSFVSHMDIRKDFNESRDDNQIQLGTGPIE
ncbi:hypothetical protein MPER_07253, partial [Moniliophthora perniciosa FA553]